MIKYSQKKIPLSEWNNIKIKVKNKFIVNGLKMNAQNQALIEIALGYACEELIRLKYIAVEPSEKDLASQRNCCIILDAIKEILEENKTC